MRLCGGDAAWRTSHLRRRSTFSSFDFQPFRLSPKQLAGLAAQARCKARGGGVATMSPNKPLAMRVGVSGGLWGDGDLPLADLSAPPAPERVGPMEQGHRPQARSPEPPELRGRQSMVLMPRLRSA